MARWLGVSSTLSAATTATDAGPTVLARGWGDCDDLIGYRVSELLAQGEAATVNCIWDGVRMHVRVRRASGDLEDPAQILHERNP